MVGSHVIYETRFMSHVFFYTVDIRLFSVHMYNLIYMYIHEYLNYVFIR